MSAENSTFTALSCSLDGFVALRFLDIGRECPLIARLILGVEPLTIKLYEVVDHR